MSWDYVIVGSGFGGAVSACRLAAAGMKVLVLERGRRWTPEEFPRDAEDAWVWNQDAPEHCDGWIDLRIMDQMWVAQGSGVGGGSLIYANISIDAPEQVFHSGWPSAITLKALRPYYDMAADMLKPARVPENQWTERFKLMRDAADAIGEKERVRALELAVTFDPEWTYQKENARDPVHSKEWTNAQGKKQGTCVHLGLCDIGCPVGAKNTLDLNYLAAAESAGATIQTHLAWSPTSPASARPGASITTISTSRRVHAGAGLCRRKAGHPRRRLARLDRDIAALPRRVSDPYPPLFPSGPRLELERRFPDAGHLQGPPGQCERRPDHHRRHRLPRRQPTRRARYFVEDGGFPNLLEHYINKRLGSASMLAAFALRRLKRMQKGSLADHIMPWFGQAIDGADGKLYLGRSLASAVAAPAQARLESGPLRARRPGHGRHARQAYRGVPAASRCRRSPGNICAP